MKFLKSIFFACFPLVLFAMSEAEYAEYRLSLIRDPSLIRFYTFEEGQGLEAANHAINTSGRIAVTGGPAGSLYLPRRTHYGINPVFCASFPQKVYLTQSWTRGRFPFKSAVDSGNDTNGMYRTGVDGSEFSKGGSFAGWIRPNPEGRILQLGSFILRVRGGKLYADDNKNKFLLSADGVIPNTWNFFAVTADGKKLVLSLNGKKCGETSYGRFPVIIPKKAEWDPQTGPFLEFHRGKVIFLTFGQFSAPDRTRIDFDELMVWNRALSQNELNEIYRKGRPELSVEQQKAEYAKVKRHRDLMDRVRMEFPADTSGYFRSNTGIPVKIFVPKEIGRKCSVVFDVTELNGRPAMKLERNVPVGKEYIEVLKPSKCGVFLIDICLKSDGKIVKRLDPSCPAAVVPPAPKHLSKHNPLGLWNNYDNFCYDIPFRRLNLPIEYMNHFMKHYEHLKKQIPDFRFSLFFYWKIEAGPAAREHNKKILKAVLPLVAKIRPEILEMTSEPRPFRPADYVTMLKETVPSLRKAIPGVKVIPPGGSTPQVPLIDGILKAGGLPWMDGISYHGYTDNPIRNFTWNENYQNLKRIVARYPDKKLTLWNSECGIDSLPRIAGRPMTSDQAVKAGMTQGQQSSHGFRSFPFYITMFQEDQAAALQIQGVLCDLAFGYRGYVCMSVPGYPSMPGAGLTVLSQFLNENVAAGRLPLSNLENMGVLCRNVDGSTDLAIFSNSPDTVLLRTKPNMSFKTMDMMGNVGTEKADSEGILKLEISQFPQYLFRVPADCKEVRVLSLKIPEKLPENGLLKGIVTIANPYREKLTGVLSAGTVDGAEIELIPSRIELAPGAEMKAEFRLKAERLKRRRYPVSVLLRNFSGKKISETHALFQSGGSLRKIGRILKPFPLDGDEVKWKGVPKMVCDSASDVVHGKPNLSEIWVPQWLGKKDLSFSLRTVWRRNDGIYFRIDVCDDHFLPATEKNISQAFLYDCLEIVFDAREKSKQGAMVSDGAEQLIVIPSNTETMTPCRFWFGGSKHHKRHLKAECSGKRTKNGYVIEGRLTPIPPAVLRVGAGSQFRMDFSVDDTDSEKILRKSILALDGNASNYLNASAWGRYCLET